MILSVLCISEQNKYFIENKNHLKLYRFITFILSFTFIPTALYILFKFDKRYKEQEEQDQSSKIDKNLKLIPYFGYIVVIIFALTITIYRYIWIKCNFLKIFCFFLMYFFTYLTFVLGIFITIFSYNMYQFNDQLQSESIIFFYEKIIKFKFNIKIYIELLRSEIHLLNGFILSKDNLTSLIKKIDNKINILEKICDQKTSIIKRINPILQEKQNGESITIGEREGVVANIKNNIISQVIKIIIKMIKDYTPFFVTVSLSFILYLTITYLSIYLYKLRFKYMLIIFLIALMIHIFRLISGYRFMSPNIDKISALLPFTDTKESFYGEELQQINKSTITQIQSNVYITEQ